MHFWYPSSNKQYAALQSHKIWHANTQELLTHCVSRRKIIKWPKGRNCKNKFFILLEKGIWSIYYLLCSSRYAPSCFVAPICFALKQHFCTISASLHLLYAYILLSLKIRWQKRCKKLIHRCVVFAWSKWCYVVVWGFQLHI